MDFNPVSVGARVRELRLRAGLSQRDLQRASGLSQSTIHRLETGVRTTVALADLDLISQALDVGLDDLLYGSSVRERIRAAARCVAGADVDTALEPAIVLLELDDRLDRVVPDLRQQRREPRLIPATSGPPETRGAGLAAQVRDTLGLGIAPVADLVEIVEELTGVDVGTAPLPSGVSGVCALDPQRDTALILVDSNELAERQRFTLAHELGHLLFGDPAHVHSISTARTVGEKRCDAFARNLLAPAVGVRSWLERTLGAVDRRLVRERHVALLARHFGVSPEVAGIALDRAGLRPGQLASLPPARALACRYGWGAQYENEQAVAAQPLVPRRLLDRAIEAYRTGTLGVAAIARLVGQPVAAVERDLADAGIRPAPRVRRADVAALVQKAPRRK